MATKLSLKKSILWAFIESMAPQAIGFFITIILARLLTPKDYGLIGMLALFVAFAQLFSDMGMSQALIQRKENSKDDETTVFYLNILIGIIITLVLILISPFVASFFNEPILRNILSVLAIGYFCSSFGIVQNALLSRNLDFKSIALVSVINTIVTGFVAVVLALLNYGVWSLVYASLAGILARVITLWSISSWRPNGKWSRDSLKSIWKFSGNILGAGLFTTFVDNLANILIGKKFSTASLGFYTKASQLQVLPVALLTEVLNKVAFPMFSRNQDDPKLLLHRLRKSVKFSVFSITFLCLFLFIIAENLIPFLFGDQWLESIKYFKILVFAGIFYPMNVLLITLIKSTGRSDLFLKVEIIKKIIIMGALLISSFFSIEAMAWSLVFTGLVAYIFNSSFAIPLVKYSWKLQIIDVLPILILFSSATIITYSLSFFYNDLADIVQILCSGFIYTTIVISVVYILKKTYFSYLWDFLIDFLIGIKLKKIK